MKEYIVTKNGVDYKVEYNPQMIDSKELTETVDSMVNALSSSNTKEFNVKGFGFDYLNLGENSIDRQIMVTRITK